MTERTDSERGADVRPLIEEINAQIVEATWWAKEGLDLENYISPEDVEKRLNFLRNIREELRAEAAAPSVQAETSFTRGCQEAETLVIGRSHGSLAATSTNEQCFTCEGESGMSATRTVRICEQCFGESAEQPPAAVAEGDSGEPKNRR